MIEITEEAVVYQAQTKMAELGYEVASTRSITKPSIQAKIRQGYQISALLRALQYGDYLTKEARERLWYCLIDVAEINDYPVAPVVGNIQPPEILVGIPGKKGDKGREEQMVVQLIFNLMEHPLQ